MKRIVPLALLLTAISGRIDPAAAEPPGDVAESSLYPIRIFHEEELAGSVEEVIAASDAAWEHLVIDVGMPAPLTLFGEIAGNGFDVVLDGGLPGAGTYEILGDNPATAAADCAVLAYLNPLAMSVEGMLEMTVHHLLARNALHAVDCIERYRPAYETFAVALGVHYPGAEAHPYWLPYELPGFQKQPWRSLDWAGSSSATDVWYAYGTALFALFVDEVWGDGDGALLPDIWARSAQDGTIVATSGPMAQADVENEPDYLDALAAAFEELGTTFDEAFARFVEWRFFVGADADGGHSEAAATWFGGEVSREALLVAGDLPVVDAPAAHPLSEYGAGYIDIDPAGLDGSLDVGFAGNPDSAWWAGLFLIPDGAPAVIAPLTLEDGAGDVEIPQPGNYRKIVLAVANLGDEQHDADLQDWSSANGDYTYSVTGPGSGDADTDTDDDTDSDEGSGADADSSDGGCGCRSVAAGGAPRLLDPARALFPR
jgi:hypothetical protein